MGNARGVYALPIALLTPELLALWGDLHERSTRPLGPFLHPAFVQAVGRARPGVEVGVVTRRGEPDGLVPFRRQRFDVGGPVGGRLCDLCGGVMGGPMDASLEELTRCFGLRALRLPNVATTDPVLASSVDEARPAPFIDLSRGFEAYRQASLDSGSRLMKQTDRKARKLEREHGPFRLEWHTTDDAVFDRLMGWKALQRKATRTPNVLELPWAKALMKILRNTREDGFASVLSALWVGDVLAAAHFGIRTRRVLHYWVPAYNVELSDYSPGLIGLMEVARAAEQRGIERIDLGPGEERYKVRAANAARDLGIATVSTGPAVASALRLSDGVRSWSRESWVGEAVRSAGRTMVRGAYAVRAAVGGPPRTGRDPHPGSA